jgi:D-sedoheptulose 7-phosphate isomerase
MKSNKNLIDYIKSFSSKIEDTNLYLQDFHKILKILNKYRKKNRVHIFGNGGSATIASHFSMDLTNNTNIKCLNYNDSAIITCFSNDFKYENWVAKVIEKYGEKNDLLILISSSGESKNMINAIKAAKKKRFYKSITLTGFKRNNSLMKNGDLNLWTNTKNYNQVESIHNFWLLMMVDMIKKNYKY